MAAAAAPLAAGAGLDVVKVAASEGAGLIRAFLTAMEKPIYSDVEVTQVTHRARNGDMIVRTKTKGWTVPLGVPVLLIGGIAAWEGIHALADAWKGIGGSSVSFLLNPINWITMQITDAAGNSQNVKVPPSFMGQLSALGQQLLTPGTMGMQKLLEQLTKAMGAATTK